MHVPGIGVPVLCGSEQIAVGEVGIDAHQNRFVAIENFVMQSIANAGKILGSIDPTGAPGSQLMQVVYTARADAHAQNVAPGFYPSTVGAVGDQREGKSDLMQPSFGHREVKQNNNINTTSRS